jgi:hypothetical protein
MADKNIFVDSFGVDSFHGMVDSSLRQGQVEPGGSRDNLIELLIFNFER